MDILSQIHSAILEMQFLEVIAVFFGISSVLYARKENILVYPSGIISTVIYVYLCFEVKLYADMSINVFYALMSVYGWIVWKSKIKNQPLEITNNTLKENIFSVLAVGMLWLIFYIVLVNFTDSDVPYIDSLTTSICFVGMWLMAWKKIENWIAWIVADLISIPLYVYKGLYLTSFQFFIFTILAILGYLEWKKRMSLQ